MLSVLPLVLLIFPGSLKSQECASRDYGHDGTVCVCNLTHCDTIPRPERVERPQLIVYSSNRAGLRFHRTIQNFTSDAAPQIYINPRKEYQTVLGWGGAFTDSTGININSLDQELQGKLLESYFGPDGIEYSLCRVPMGGTDFSTRAYSYDDGEEDKELNNFRLAREDYLYKIPYIKAAFNLSDNDFQLIASTWTAPRWMKTNREYSGFGFIRESMYQTWANYFVKFLDEYQNEGVTFWGVTTGNEPADAFIFRDQLEVVGWTPWLVSEWISSNLGPTIRNSNHSNVKIMILDDQRAFLPWYVDKAFINKMTRQYTDGIAVHWYTDDIFPAYLLSETHEHFPEKFILATEASNMPQFGQKPVVLGSWQRGENYSDDIIKDLLNWVTGWIDWNMVLDLDGGPNYIRNFVDAPLVVNSTSGEFYKQPMYYHVGHFSKFVPRGSVRIGVEKRERVDVECVAFRRPDNGTVVVIFNRRDESGPVGITTDGVGTAQINVTPRSINTILYW